jgi:hypothetical protein
MAARNRRSLGRNACYFGFAYGPGAKFSVGWIFGASRSNGHESAEPMIVLMPMFQGMVAHRTYSDIAAFVDVVAGAGYDPVAVAGIIERESAKTWSPSVRGSSAFTSEPVYKYAVGLLQFAPGTCRTLGKDTAQFAAMTFLEQVSYIPKYYAIFGGPSKFTRPADYYAAGWGSGVGAPDAYVLAKDGEPKYAANANLDRNNSGTITIGDLLGSLTDVINAASKNGYWKFDTGNLNISAIQARYVGSPNMVHLEMWALLKWSKL